MDWLTSLNKGAGAGEVQLTYNPDQGTIDITTHLGISPKFSSVAQEDASAFLQAELRSARLGLLGFEVADLVAYAIETGYSESPVVAAYMFPEFPDRDKRARYEELAEFLFTIAENLTNDIISGMQFDRSDFGKYVVSGLPDDYYQYVALGPHPPLNQRDTAKVAVLVRANVESYVNNSLLVNGISIRYGQISSEIYSVSTAYAGLVDSAGQLVGAVKAAMDRDLSEAEITLVEAVYAGDQAAIMQTLWEVSPEGAEMVPRGLPAPIMPGQTYEASKGSTIPIKLVGQWAKEPPDSWYEKIRGKTPDTEEEPEVEEVLKPPKWHTLLPAWKRSFLRIVSYSPSRAVATAVEEMPVSEDPSWEEARDFMHVLRGQKYLTTRSKGYIEWWLQNWGEVPPEELYAPEEVPEEPEPELPSEVEMPYIPWTQR